MKIDVNSTIAKIAKKSKVSVAELTAEYTEILKTIAPSDNKEYNALRELNKKHSDRSPAVAVTGVVISLGNLFDYSRKKIETAMEAAKVNLQDAIDNKIVEVKDGVTIPLDPIETFSTGTKNSNFGKELKHSYSRKCLFLADTDKGVVLTTLELRGQVAFLSEALPPLNAGVSFRSLGTVEDGLRSSESEKITKFTTENVLNEQQIQQLIHKHCEGHVMFAGDCFKYHLALKEGSQEFYDRYVVTSGSVAMIKPATEEGKNHFMLLEDPTLDDPVGCFIEGNLPPPEQGSDITIIAQTNKSKGWDSKEKVTTDEDVLNLNVLNIL